MLVRERLSAPVQTGPGTHPALCTRGNGSLSGGRGEMKPGRGVDHLLPLAPRLKKE